MSQKKALDITTKDWSGDEIKQMTQTVNSQNYRWQAKIKTKKGKIKYAYFYSKVDLEIMAKQENFTILKVTSL